MRRIDGDGDVGAGSWTGPVVAAAALAWRRSEARCSIPERLLPRSAGAECGTSLLYLHSNFKKPLIVVLSDEDKHDRAESHRDEYSQMKSQQTAPSCRQLQQHAGQSDFCGMVMLGVPPAVLSCMVTDRRL